MKTDAYVEIVTHRALGHACAVIYDVLYKRGTLTMPEARFMSAMNMKERAFEKHFKSLIAHKSIVRAGCRKCTATRVVRDFYEVTDVVPVLAPKKSTAREIELVGKLIRERDEAIAEAKKTRLEIARLQSVIGRIRQKV